MPEYVVQFLSTVPAARRLRCARTRRVGGAAAELRFDQSFSNASIMNETMSTIGLAALLGDPESNGGCGVVLERELDALRELGTRELGGQRQGEVDAGGRADSGGDSGRGTSAKVASARRCNRL